MSSKAYDEQFRYSHLSLSQYIDVWKQRVAESFVVQICFVCFDLNSMDRDLTKEGKDVECAYWELVTKDIRDTSVILEPIYKETTGLDGYVSVQVSPWLADNTKKIVKAAKWLHKKLGRPNVYTKIPATAESIPAIKQVISQGISVNATVNISICSLKKSNDILHLVWLGALSKTS